MSEGKLLGFYPDGFDMCLIPFWDVCDEGAGEFSMLGCRGIYQQDDHRLTVCFRDDRQGHPASFQGGNGQALAILRRVRPRK